jgi:hypothetical protein
MPGLRTLKMTAIWRYCLRPKMKVHNVYSAPNIIRVMESGDIR